MTMLTDRSVTELIKEENGELRKMVSTVSKAAQDLREERESRIEDRFEDIIDKFDFGMLREVDRYVVNLGKDFSPVRDQKRLRYLRYLTETEIGKEYEGELVYHQDSGDYEFIISKTKDNRGKQ